MPELGSSAAYQALPHAAGAMREILDEQVRKYERAVARAEEMAWGDKMRADEETAWVQVRADEEKAARRESSSHPPDLPSSRVCAACPARGPGG